jgi:hypothetical protein
VVNRTTSWSSESNVNSAASSARLRRFAMATETASRARFMLPPTDMLPLMSSSTARLTGESPDWKSRISRRTPASMTSKSAFFRLRTTRPRLSRTEALTDTTSTLALNVTGGS